MLVCDPLAHARRAQSYIPSPLLITRQESTELFPRALNLWLSSPAPEPLGVQTLPLGLAREILSTAAPFCGSVSTHLCLHTGGGQKVSLGVSLNHSGLYLLGQGLYRTWSLLAAQANLSLPLPSCLCFPRTGNPDRLSHGALTPHSEHFIP